MTSFEQWEKEKIKEASVHLRKAIAIMIMIPIMEQSKSLFFDEKPTRDDEIPPT